MEAELAWQTTDGRSIVARCWEPPVATRCVVIVHGLGDHSGRFAHVARFLVERGCGVLAPDLRGHGRSSGPRGHFPSYAHIRDDLQQAVEAAAARWHHPTILYGQSLGGLLALDYGLQRPQDLGGIIASSPALEVAARVPAWKRAVARSLGAAMPRVALSTGLDVRDLTDDRDQWPVIASDPLRHSRISASTYIGMLRTGRTCLDQAPSLSVRALVLHGDQDRVTDCQASAEFSARSGAAFCRWPGGLHELHNLLDQQQVLQSIADWLVSSPSR